MLTPCVVIQATQILKEKENKKDFLSVKLIFQDHWFDYKRTHNPREVEIEEVEKMLSCKLLRALARSSLQIVSLPFDVNGKLAFFVKDKLSGEVGLIYNSNQIKLPFKPISMEFLIGLADLIFYVGDKENKQVLVSIYPDEI